MYTHTFSLSMSTVVRDILLYLQWLQYNSSVGVAYSMILCEPQFIVLGTYWVHLRSGDNLDPFNKLVHRMMVLILDGNSEIIVHI